MTLTVRLDRATRRALNALARRRNVSRSDVVREAIAHYGAHDAAGDQPYEAWADVIGVVRLGARDAARTTGEQFTEMLSSGRHARRSR